MDELGCSQATLYRLIAELRDQLGAPLEQDSDGRGFYYDRQLAGHFELPGLWISPEELQALLTARHILSNVQPGLLEDELQGVQDRINQLLDQQGLGFSAQPERIHIRKDAGRPVPSELFEDILQTLFQRQQVVIEYHGRRRDELNKRLVSPQRLTSYRDRWYLDAWCHEAAGLRSFALERIRRMEVVDAPAKEVALKRLSAELDQAFGIFSGPADHQALLVFNEEAARWASEERWHREQTGRWLPDGSYELSFPFGQTQELLMEILRYGPDVEVKSPQFLREEVANSLKLAIKRYE